MFKTKLALFSCYHCESALIQSVLEKALYIRYSITVASWNLTWFYQENVRITLILFMT